jgi:hypothetical protein
MTEEQKVPPGIIRFATKQGTLYFQYPHSDYDNWVNFHLTEGSTIHTISVDGKEWSVWDEFTWFGSSVNKVESFEYREDRWFANGAFDVEYISKLQPQKKDWDPRTKMIMEAYGDDPKDFPYDSPIQKIIRGESKKDEGDEIIHSAIKNLELTGKLFPPTHSGKSWKKAFEIAAKAHAECHQLNQKLIHELAALKSQPSFTMPSDEEQDLAANICAFQLNWNEPGTAENTDIKKAFKKGIQWLDNYLKQTKK